MMLRLTLSVCSQVILCSACTDVHKKLPVSISHDVESLSTVTPERLAATRPALCADHGDKQAEFFCNDHRLAVCSACKSNIHKVCPEAKYLDDEIESAQNSLKDLTKILVEAEQKLEQAIGQLTSRLQEVDISEQEDMAQVDKTCDRLQKLVDDFRKKLKEKTRTSHFKIRNLLHDLKTDLNNRLGKVTSHKHIVTRATAVSPRPALIHMRQTLTDRVNTLDLNADFEEDMWMKPLSEAEFSEDFVGRIEKELLMFEQQKTESELEAQAPVLVFHENCGTNIRLTNCNTTAEKIVPEGIGNGVVVSRDAMLTNVLYEVLNTLGKGLERLQVGSRVGLLVDSSNDIHLYVEGYDQGVAHHVTQPCFAVFGIYSTVIRVTALPTTRRYEESLKTKG